jgi:hypothetical protein
MMRIYRWTAGITVLLLAGGLFRAAAVASDLGVTSGSARWMALFITWGGLLAAVAALWVLALLPAGAGSAARATRAWSRFPLPPLAAIGLAAGLAFVLPALTLAPLPDPLNGLMVGFWWRAVVFWMAALVGTALLYRSLRGVEIVGLFAGVVVMYAVVYRIAAFLPDLSTNPFSVGWSEASRYYYASLFMSERVYGVSVPPSVLHPSRYLMQAIPFLVDGLPLWFHRLWQVGLWLGANGLAAILLVRRVEIGSRPLRFVLAGWAFLFLFQGPVWYHLAVIPAFLFWGVRPTDFRRTLLAVSLTSVWAGVSRVNWIPLPAALAALIYLIEVDRADKTWTGYLKPVFFWGLAGAAAGFGAQYAYTVLSGNPADLFGSSFTSDLLWYRLFPSATFPLGVLPGILLVSLPAAAIVSWLLRKKKLQISGLRRLGIGLILAVFFAGGLVVSVKIGGGSNLHNLDGYIVLLLAAVVILFFRSPTARSGIPLRLAVLAALVPAGFAISTGGPLPTADRQALDRELTGLAELVETAAADGTPVLFIAQRHLIAFDLVEGVELVPGYEKVFLMEMAMAGHAGYLDEFRSDLMDHRFGLIVSDVVRFNTQTRDDQFGEENNAWDVHVSAPILCYYEEQVTFPESRVQVLVPRESAEPCELNGAGP